MINKTLLACTLAFIVGGCGGSDSGGETPTPTPAAIATIDLVVDTNFVFRTDMDLTLELTEVPTGGGVINIYYDYDFHDLESDLYYPNPRTRVLTFHTEATTSVIFQVSKNWGHLVAEFLPTDPQGTEMYKKLDLSTNDQLSFHF